LTWWQQKDKEVPGKKKPGFQLSEVPLEDQHFNPLKPDCKKHFSSHEKADWCWRSLSGKALERVFSRYLVFYNSTPFEK
jgi:hypothetical protein